MAHHRPVTRLERVLGAVEITFGVVLLSAGVLGFVPVLLEHWSPPPPPDAPHHGGGNWLWVLTMFLIPPGVLLALAGAALRGGRPAGRWLQLLALPTLLAGCFALGVL